MSKHKYRDHKTQDTVDVTTGGSAYSSIPVVQKDGVVSQEISLPENPIEIECLPGFEPISTAPKTGNRIVVSETGQDAIAVFWRERRVVNKEKLRYEKQGGWTGVLSRLDIDFEPKFWRPYSAMDYIPVPRVW